MVSVNHRRQNLFSLQLSLSWFSNELNCSKNERDDAQVWPLLAFFSRGSQIPFTFIPRTIRHWSRWAELLFVIKIPHFFHCVFFSGPSLIDPGSLCTRALNEVQISLVPLECGTLQSRGAFDPLVFMKLCHELAKNISWRKLLVGLIKQYVRDKKNACFAFTWLGWEETRLSTVSRTRTSEHTSSGRKGMDLRATKFFVLEDTLPKQAVLSRGRHGRNAWRAYRSLPDVSICRSNCVSNSRLILPGTQGSNLLNRRNLSFCESTKCVACFAKFLFFCDHLMQTSQTCLERHTQSLGARANARQQRPLLPTCLIS